MRPIKVVFSIGGMHGGGSERQMVSLLRNIDRDRIEPILYLVYRTGPLLSEIPADIPVHAFDERWQGARWPGILMHRRRVRDMAAFFKEVGAEVSYDRTFLMTIIAADAAQRAGVPNISTIVTDPPVGFGTVAGRFQGIKRRILGRLYRQSWKVLANSEGAARSAETFYGLPEGLVETHYNGVDIDRVRQLSETVIDDEWWNAPPTTERRLFRIVTAGRLNEKKGFHFLIDAVDEVQRHYADVEFRLAILGEGPGREELSEQIAARSLTDSVRLIGFRENAAAWYKSADVFVLPSLLEGMPNVLLEAMACGTAVLSTDCRSGPAEILRDSGLDTDRATSKDGGRMISERPTGAFPSGSSNRLAGRPAFGELCDVGSVPALVTGLRKFVDDPSLADRYNSVAVPHVEKTFSIQSAVRQLEDMLVAAAESRRQ